MSADVRDMSRGIERCPSAAHRCVLGLVRAAMGHPVGDWLISDLEASKPEDIVRIATFHYVHVVVGSAFDRVPTLGEAVPQDLVIYFREMQAANLRRNAAILAELRAVGGVLAEAGLRGVVLKGGVELLAPVYPEPAFRFLSDIDILAPEGELERAVAVLVAQGAQPAGGVETATMSEIDQARHHHAEPLAAPGWPVVVELHRRLGQEGLGDLLAPEAVVRDARPVDLPGLAVPSPTHRLAHAVLHAQLEPARYADGVLSLRDAVEMEVVESGMAPGEVAAARALFNPQQQAAWDALSAVRALLFGGAARIDGLAPASRSWAERAIIGFGQPGRRRLRDLGRWGLWYTREFLTNPERRRHYLAQLRRPARIRRAIAAHRDRFRRTR